MNNSSGSGEASTDYVMGDGRIVAGGRIDVASNMYQWRVVRLLGA